MVALQSRTPDLPGNDGYYHLRMAALLPDLGFVKSFPWLRWTIFSDRFVSHHHGFHILLSPFAWVSQRWLGDAVPGGKMASAVAMAATFIVFHALLRQLGLRSRTVWLLLLCAAPWHFWLRMAYLRAPVVALPMLLLATLWTIRGRTMAVGILAFAFTHVYGGGVLFPLVPISLLAGHLLTREAARTPLHQCIAAAAGVLLGLIISPYFPANLEFLYTQLFETGLGAAEDVGTEWRPYDAWYLFGQSFPLAVAWGWCLIRRLRAGEPARGTEIGLLVLNAAFLVLTLKARRFVEYWPPFALLNAACFLAVAESCRPAAMLKEYSSGFLSRWHRSASSALVVSIGLVGILNLRLTRSEIKPSSDVLAIRGAMDYLKEHSEQGSLVFTDDWDIFPTCFYFNHHNTYAVGLDPEFTRTRYPALWERYRRITRAELPAKLPGDLTDKGDRTIRYEDIATAFEARYVLVERDHAPLFRALSARAEQFKRVYPETVAKSESVQPAITIFEVITEGIENR